MTIVLQIEEKEANKLEDGDIWYGKENSPTNRRPQMATRRKDGDLRPPRCHLLDMSCFMNLYFEIY